MNWPRVPLPFVLVLLFLSFAGGGYTYHRYLQKIETRVVGTPAPPDQVKKAYPHLILPKSDFPTSLRDLGVRPEIIRKLMTAARPTKDLRRLPVGTRFRLIRLTDPRSDPIQVDVQISSLEKVSLRQIEGNWTVRRSFEEVETRVVAFEGQVKTDLWASAKAARMDASLILQLAEIFSWEIDFAREVRRGDRWALRVEQKLIGGVPVGWGTVLSAEYLNGDRLLTAILFPQRSAQSAYYSADGSSVQKRFLKSPMRFARVNSQFQNQRFHPVLKKNRPHLGIDYGAPKGTPVRVVADGVVSVSAWSATGGNSVRIGHGSGYETAYLHLSRIEKDVRKGRRVRQGQVIGYVGATGLATGPHLHFELIQNGKFKDPLKQEFESVTSIPSEKMDEFKTHVSEVSGLIRRPRKFANRR